MASSLIGSLRVALGLDTAQFEAGANKSRSIARGLSKDIESSFKSAKVAVEGLVAAFAIGALTEQIKQSLEYAAAIGETASTLGVTTKQLQEFRFAATQTGVAQEQLEGGLQRLTVSIGKSKLGSEAQTKAFDALAKASHTTVAELRSGNTGDVFLKIADSLSKVTDRSQRAAAEVALFGKSGAQLDSLLAGGTARLNALADAAHQLGVVLSESQIRDAEQTAHKLEALKMVLEANIASTVTANANSILALAQALGSLTNSILHFLGSNPQLALAIIGGLAGSRFGLVGAAAGAVGGAYLGEKVGQNAADANMDIAFRRKALHDARDALNLARSNQNLAGRAMPGVGVELAPDIGAAKKEFDRQLKLAYAAAASARQGSAPPPGVNLPAFLSPKEPKGRKAPADRSDELLAQMDKEILQADQNILQAKQSLAGTNEQHLQIAIQLVQLEKTIREKAIDEEIAKAEREHAEHKITDAALKEAEHKAATLKAAAETEAQVKLQAIVEAELTKTEQANFQAADQQMKFRLDALHTADTLATTQADHRRIQLQILDSEINQRRYELEHEKQLAIRNGATAEQIKVIQDQINNLANDRAQGAAVINRNTQNPLEAWAQQVPKTAAEINEALKSIEVKGIDGLSEAITGVLTGTESLKNAFHNLAASILSDLIQMTIKMLLFKALEASFGGSFGGGGAGVPVSGARASGGSVMGSQAYLVGERGPEIFMPKTSGSIIPNSKLNFGNDNMAAPQVSIPIHIDATGADAAGLARVQNQLDSLKSELPGLVVEYYTDARQRFVIRK